MKTRLIPERPERPDTKDLKQFWKLILKWCAYVVLILLACVALVFWFIVKVMLLPFVEGRQD